MEDPFGLLEIASGSPKKKPKKEAKKLYLTVISVLVVFILVLVTLFIFQNNGQISADTISSSGAIKITNLPSEVKTGENINFNLVFTNKGDNIEGGFALIQSSGINLSQTIQAAKNLTSGDSGYVRRMSEDEYSHFEQKGDSGIYLFLGNFPANQSRSVQLTAAVTTGGTVPANLEAKLFSPKSLTEKCGFLGLRRCSEIIGDNQIASGTFQIESTDTGKIKLKSGFNFVSLPYIFTPGALSEFFSSMKTKWAYIYDPSTAGYLDLNVAGNVSRVKPGAAFWLYDKDGGDYDLPQNKVETNTNETYTIPLLIGWNQVGNPYSKKMILSGDKILVHELAADSSESGTSYDFKTAISNGTLSDPYFVTYDSTAGSAVSTVKTLLESIVEPFSGFFINATKQVNLIVPGKEVITPGDNLSAQERSKIESWISENGLNQYGDPSGTVYAGGNPLFNELAGQTIDRFDYILQHYPDRPWNR